MKHLMCAIAVAALITTSPVWAQSIPDVVRDAVFSEVEKRIIGEHYGVDVQDMMKNATLPEWAVKRDRTDGTKEDDDDRDNREDGDRSKKDKKNKKDKDKSKGLPPGLAKRDTLPPGLQKQLDTKGRLPPGLAKRNLPDDLAAKLPKRSDQHDVVVVEDDVVLIDKATGVILDVLKDVVRGRSAPVQNPDGTLNNPGPQSQTEASDGVLDAIIKSIFGGK